MLTGFRALSAMLTGEEFECPLPVLDFTHHDHVALWADLRHIVVQKVQVEKEFAFNF